MPRPSPRKLGKSRDISDSPERIQIFGQGNQSPSDDIKSHDVSIRDKKQRRKINKQILKEIRKHVKDEV